MARFAVLSMLIAAMLAGCGQVIVFGHVVGEHKTGTGAEPNAGGAGTAKAEQPQSATPASASTADTTASASIPPAARSPVIARVVKAVNITVTPEAVATVKGDA